MNNSYYETLDENFTQALRMYEQNYSQEELYAFLESGNIVQKQISALKLVGVFSSHQAKILVSNLTGQDGKIREAVSLRLKEFMSEPEMLRYFMNLSNYDVFLDAVIDINGNICRNVIGAIINLKSDEEFCNCFCSKLVDLTLELLDKVEKFDFQDGKYKINKEVFKLYWCLETIFEFRDKIEFARLKQILLRSKDIEEYTIREKAAKILATGYEDNELIAAQRELQNDRNYYVKRY